MTDTASYQVLLRFSATSAADITADVLQFAVARRMARVFDSLDAGTADIVLDNASGDYSPARTSGPYGSLLKPRVAVEIKATNPVTYPNTLRPFFYGYVDNYDVQPSLLGPRQTVLRCSDFVSELGRRRVTTEVMTNITASTAFAVTLAVGSITTAQRSIDAIGEILPFVWFRDVGLPYALNELIQGGAYAAYVAGDGTLRIRDRLFELGGSVTGSYEEFYSLTYARSADKVINRVKVTGQPRRISSNVETLAALGEVIAIPASSGIGFWLNYLDPRNQEPAPAIGVLTPVQSVDWFTNAASDGGGADRTSTCSVSAVLFAESAVCSVFNGGGSTVYLTKLSIRGKSIQRLADISIDQINSQSIIDYGIREFNLESRLLGTRSLVAAVGEAVLTVNADQTDAITMALRNVYPDVVVNDLGDIVHITNSHLGLNQQYTIVGLQHDVVADGGGGFIHAASYELELSVSGTTLVLNHPVRGRLDFNRLGRLEGSVEVDPQTYSVDETDVLLV